MTGTLLRGVAWSIALPPWQGPDEPAHYWYATELAHGRLPPLGDDSAATPDLVRAVSAAGFDTFRSRSPGRPFTAERARVLRTLDAHALPPTAGDVHGARGYPPLYYAAVAPAWAIAQTPETRLALARLVSALLSALLAYLTFRLVLELTARPRLALGGALLVGLPPMVSQASAIVNPDVLLAAGTAGLADACARLMRRRTARDVAAVVAWSAVVAGSKPIGAALAAITLASFLAVPQLARLRGRALAAAAGTMGVAALAGLLYVAASPTRRATARFSLDYLGDFYRPSGSSGAVDVWIRSATGRFGWLDVRLPTWVVVVAAASIVAAIAIAALTRGGAPLARPARDGVVACAVAVVGYLGLLNAVEAHALANGRTPLLQGRYLTAIAPLAVAGFLALASRLPQRRSTAVCVGLSAVWLVVSLAALDTVVTYYAS